MSTVTVYCGADKNPEFAQEMYALGKMLARHFEEVVYGGGLENGTMMGELARGVLENGGRLKGVISKDYWKEGQIFPEGMTALAVRSEAERNAITLASDQIIVAPGQIGTLHESTAALAFNRARIKRDEPVKPLYLLDLKGFFSKLSGFLQDSFETFGEAEENKTRYYQRIGSVAQLSSKIATKP